MAAELRIDSRELDELASMNERAVGRIRAGANDALDYGALGYTIHNIYGVVENACLRISKLFENNLPAEAWYRALLDRMILDIPTLRPAFFSREAYLVMDELRSFRHVFRNIYSRELDSERIMALQKKIPLAIHYFQDSVSRYTEFLGRLAASIED